MTHTDDTWDDYAFKQRCASLAKEKLGSRSLTKLAVQAGLNHRYFRERKGRSSRAIFKLAHALGTSYEYLAWGDDSFTERNQIREKTGGSATSDGTEILGK